MNDYSQSEAVNFSTLKAIARSPLHYLEAVANARRTTKAMGNGLAAHRLSLQPETLSSVAVCSFSRGTRAWDLYEACRVSGEVPAVYDGAVRRGKAWDAFESAHAGQLIALASEWAAVEPLLRAPIVMSQEELDLARAMADAVHAHPDARRLLSGGLAEVPVYWTDTATGIDCKGRVDYLADGVLVDLKTTQDVSPGAFARRCAQLQTHAQLAMYSDGCFAKSAKHRDCYVIAVEQDRPHDVAVYRLPDEVIEAGREQYRGWLARLAECVETDEWPGAVPGVADLVLPAWAMPVSEGSGEFALNVGGESFAF